MLFGSDRLTQTSAAQRQLSRDPLFLSFTPRTLTDLCETFSSSHRNYSVGYLQCFVWLKITISWFRSVHDFMTIVVAAR